MKKEQRIGRYQSSRILKASLLKPTNLLVLIVGCLAGGFSFALVPIGILAYGALCWLDLSSKDFAKKVLAVASPSKERPLHSPLPPGFQLETSAPLQVQELATLQRDISRIRQKISRLYAESDDATRQCLGDLSRIEELGRRSERFLLKAQHLHDYLHSEDLGQIRDGIAALQHKIEASSDPFSRQQYQQALAARMHHRQNLDEIGTAYERLVSQVTNISLSLESLYSRMVKINTTGCSSTQYESEHVATELREMLREVEFFETALNEQLSPNQT